MDVTVYGPLRSATGQKHVQIGSDGETVRDALNTFVTAYPRAKRHLFQDDGQLVASVRISVNGETAEPDDQCPLDASLAIHPAMQGG